jgi:hypothetical protein
MEIQDRKITKCLFRINGARTMVTKCQTMIISAKYYTSIIDSLDDCQMKRRLERLVDDHIRFVREASDVAEDILVAAICELKEGEDSSHDENIESDE